MKPFSAFYFIKHNRSRSLALIFMISVTAILYLGAIYITSPRIHNERVYQPYQDYAFANLQYPSTPKDYERYKEMVNSLGSLKAMLPFTNNTCISSQNEMMIKNSIPTIMLTTEEDMKLFANTIPALLDCESIPTDGELVISSSLAKNANLQLNDYLPNESNENDSTRYKIVSIVDSKEFFAYGVDTSLPAYSVLLLRGGSKEAFAKDLLSLPANYNGINLTTYQSVIDSTYRDLGTFNIIFYLSLFLITAVLVITINATFVATYEKRTHEFSIYQALGFHRFNIISKIFKEILLMDLIGMIVALTISVVILFVMNKMVLNPKGLGLTYVNGLSITSILISNISIVLFSLLFRVRWFLKLESAT